MNNPAGAAATAGTGTTPGATQQSTEGPQSQGPNDPVNPPASGGSGQPATGGQQDGSTTETPDQIALRNAREANARMAQERDEARRQAEELRRQGLGEDERKRLQEADQRDAAAKERERGLILRYEIATRAARLGLVDPEVAVMLLEKSPGVTISENGQVTGLDEALKDLIKQKPFLVKAAPPADGGAGTGGARPHGSRGMNDIIRRAVRGTSTGGE